MAWFSQNDFSPLDGMEVGTGEQWYGRGERVRHDTTLSTPHGGSRILRCGGAIVKRPDETLMAIQPFLFINRFSRCFSKGLEIVRLSESPLAQAEALARANTQIKSRHEELMNVPLWKGIKDRKSIRKKKEELNQWDWDLMEHIAELRSHAMRSKRINSQQ